MDKPKYALPAEQRTHREQPAVYTRPETFEHPAPNKLPEDTPVPTVPLEAVHPIPVTVVDMPRGPERVVSVGLTNYSIAPGGEASISRNDNRLRLRLINADAAKTLYVNTKAGSQTQGYPLLAGKELATVSTRELYVYNPDAVVNVQVGVMYEIVAELA